MMLLRLMLGYASADATPKTVTGHGASQDRRRRFTDSQSLRLRADCGKAQHPQGGEN